MTPPAGTQLARLRLLGHLLGAMVAGCLIAMGDGLVATPNRASGSERLAAMSLAVLLLLPVLMPIGLFLAALAWGWHSAAVARVRGWFLATRRRRWTMAALGVAGGGVLLLGGLRMCADKSIDWRAVDLRGAGLLLGGATIYLVLAGPLSRLPGYVLGCCLLIAPAPFGLALATYRRAGDAQAAALLWVGTAAPLGARLQAWAIRVFDRDGDGYPSLLCSKGCDCDDEDPAVSPAAADEPGNGIDEDCSGRDATPEEVERFARVFSPPAPEEPPPAPLAEGPLDEPAPAPLIEDEPPPAPLALPAPRRRGSHRRERHRRLTRRTTGAAVSGPILASAPLPGKGPGPRQQILPGGRPNILLITIDTLRADHVGAYGYPARTTPRIDAWAQEGVIFEQARAAGPATRFSIPAMLTGKHFTEVHRTAAEWPRIEDDEVLLAERLRDAGYHTAAFHSVVYLQDRYGFGQGFAHRDLSFFRSTDNVWQAPTAEYVTDHVLRYADRSDLAGRAPFFLWAYYGDPHYPYIRHPLQPGYSYSSAYDGEVAFTDYHVGRLLSGLRERGLLANTLVILSSDHGEGLDRKEDHGSRHHSKNLHDELIRVPLIIAGPNVRPRRVQTPVSLIDLVPTVMDLLGAHPDPTLRGESLAPYLRGGDPPHRPVFSEKHRSEDPVEKAMVLWPYKVIMVLPYNEFSIYDLSHDPKERDNLAQTLPRNERDRLIGTLQYWTRNILHPAGDNPRH